GGRPGAGAASEVASPPPSLEAEDGPALSRRAGRPGGARRPRLAGRAGRARRPRGRLRLRLRFRADADDPLLADVVRVPDVVVQELPGRGIDPAVHAR